MRGDFLIILFQGDSITDAGRDRSDCHLLGEGYPHYAAEYIKLRFPDENFEFMNLDNELKPINARGYNAIMFLLSKLSVNC